MDKWSKNFFGVKKVPKNCIVVLGITREIYLKKILGILNKVREVKTREVPKSYFAKYKGKEFLIVFHIYGAAFTLDILRILHEGGCKNVIAVGQCGTKKDIPVTTIILPSKVKCMDGIINIANPNIDFSYPNKFLFNKTKQILKAKRIKFYIGQTVSVPSVLHKISSIERKSGNQKYLAIECEMSTFLYFAKEMRMKAAGILVVRDNPKITLHDHPKRIYLGRLRGVEIAVETLRSFN